MLKETYRGVAKIFQRGITLCQSEGTYQIVMSFLPSVVGCLLKKKACKRWGGGGHGQPRTPPWLTPLTCMCTAGTVEGIRAGRAIALACFA